MSATTTTDLAIPTRVIGDYLAIYLSDDQVLISSHSVKNAWRVVDITHRTCSCPGLRFNNCPHLGVAQIAAEIERREARPVRPEITQPIYVDEWKTERPMCAKCGRRPVGLDHGRTMSTCNICLWRVD